MDATHVKDILVDSACKFFLILLAPGVRAPFLIRYSLGQSFLGTLVWPLVQSSMLPPFPGLAPTGAPPVNVTLSKKFLPDG